MDDIDDEHITSLTTCILSLLLVEDWIGLDGTGRF